MLDSELGATEAVVEADEEGGTKRKGSLLSKFEVKKMSADVGATIASERRSFRRQNSMPDMLKTGTIKDRKGSPSAVAFSDMVKMTFSDTTFAKSLTPLLYDMMSPLISKTIETSVAATVEAAVSSVQTKVVNQMLESNIKLQESVTKQTQVIEKQNKLIETQGKIISEQEKTIAEKSTILESKLDTIDQLEMQVDYLTLELDSVKLELNDLEQYGRRNSIRLNNFSPPTIPKSEDQLTDVVTQFLNEKVLKDAGPLRNREIGRAHV